MSVLRVWLRGGAAFVFLCVFSTVAFAADPDTRCLLGKDDRPDDPNCYIIRSVQNFGADQEGPSESAPIVPSDIVNAFRTVWDIIVKGEPVVNADSLPFAAALPVGVTDWSKMESWKHPVSYKYVVSARNVYNIEVIHLDYAIQYTHGGSLDGVGKYLTNVTIVPGKLRVLWGFQFDFKTAVATVVNIGTKKSPVAGMQVVASSRIQQKYPKLQDLQESRAFFITGEGKFEEVRAPKAFANSLWAR